MKALTPAERAIVRQRISAALANLGEFRLYWLPSHHCIACRSVQVDRRFRVPLGAVEVGRYAAPIRAADVLGDLADLIATLPETAPVLTARPDDCELHQPEPETALQARVQPAGDAIKVARRRPHAAHPWRAS